MWSHRENHSISWMTQWCPSCPFLLREVSLWVPNEGVVSITPLSWYHLALPLCCPSKQWCHRGDSDCLWLPAKWESGKGQDVKLFLYRQQCPHPKESQVSGRPEAVGASLLSVLPWHTAGSQNSELCFSQAGSWESGDQKMGNSFLKAPVFYWNSALCECLKNTKEFVLFCWGKVNTTVDNCSVFLHSFGEGQPTDSF